MSLDVTQYASATTREIGKRIDMSLRAVDAGLAPPPDWNLPIQHWSPSSFSMLRRCPYQWQQRYIHGRKERPGEAPVLGTSIHAALEWNFEQKITSHVDLDLVDMDQRFAGEFFPRVCNAEQEKSGEEIKWDTGPEATLQRGRRIVTTYHENVSPRITDPLKVETSFSVDFGLAVPVYGRFDLERNESTVDFKTGKQRQSKPKEDWRIQAGIYSEATGKPVEFHSLSASPKTNAVTIVTPLESEELLVSPTDAERTEMRRAMRAISAEACMYMAIFGPDEPWPTHGTFHTWACSFCGFRSSCPAWRGRS